MKKYAISIRSFGEHSILVEWPNRVEEPILNDILAFIQDLESNRLEKNEWEFVPSYNSLTLIKRESLVNFEVMSKSLHEWYLAMEHIVAKQKFLWRLPVCYDLDFGIDLEEVSNYLNRSTHEIIDLHTSHAYRVYGIGFLPGFMYLGGLPQSLEMPRKATPRIKVGQGAVGLAGKQTGIYPQESPGGWNIIGKCSVPIFNVEQESPCFVSVGDKIQFYQISKAEYELHKIQQEVGIYQLEKIMIDA